MSQARQELGCGRVVRPDGRIEVVVAGGWDVQDGATEILDVDTATWRAGPKLPTPIRAAAHVQYKVGSARARYVP